MPPSTPPPSLLLLRNTSMAIRCDQERGLGALPSAALLIENGKIAWLGPESELPAGLTGRARVRDLGGRLLTPGLVDCHAHPVFAGKRAGEFSRRARGDHYLDIAREGGGIKATVGPTRAASEATLVSLCSRRMAYALAAGTTTMEAKSGYDLSVSGELRLLRVAAAVSQSQPVTLRPTLLGAHALPAEYENDRHAFITAVVDEMIPLAATQGLAEAVDVYCDEGAFTVAETQRVLESAKAHGLKIKAHVGQFSDLGGPELLAELGALSGDHLEQISEGGMAAMAARGVVATLLPGACVQLKMTPPPVAELRRSGVLMALGSDLNPGTSHSESLPLAMWLATTHLGMSVEEAWLGVTRHAARALGDSSLGSLAIGAPADLVVWDAEEPAEVPYHFGVNLVHAVYKAGEQVHLG